MKMKRIFWVSLCLLFTCASLRLNAEEDEHSKSPGKTDSCFLVKEEGVCRSYLTRYFYNNQSKQCESFIYTGCLGNMNNFRSLEECKNTCEDPLNKDSTQPVPVHNDASKPELTKNRGKTDSCFLVKEEGVCRSYLTRYFYNNQSKQCESFIYTGCLGNMNNFRSLEECKNTCEDPLNKDSTQPVPVHNDASKPELTKNRAYRTPSWCLTPADRGLCNANVTRFYYNSDSKTCLQFNYSGCGGNENNFTSKKSCLRACRKDLIKNKSGGQVIKLKPKEQKPRRSIQWN